MVNFMAWLCFMIALFSGVTARILGVHMTEGEILINYWYLLLISIVFCILGILLLKYDYSNELELLSDLHDTDDTMW